MRKLTEKLVGRILPKATGKAAPARGACWSGCGESGIWRDFRGTGSTEKAPCC